jgi:hypothetical protein
MHSAVQPRDLRCALRYLLAVKKSSPRCSCFMIASLVGGNRCSRVLQDAHAPMSFAIIQRYFEIEAWAMVAPCQKC